MSARGRHAGSGRCPTSHPRACAETRMSPETNDPDVDSICKLLESVRSVAVVGISDNPERASHGIAAYLRKQGYTIFPVNPKLTSWEGLPAYPTLREIPDGVDMVDVFRAPDAVPEITRDAIAIGARVLWLQPGAVHADSIQRARDAGMEVVADRCVFESLLRCRNRGRVASD
jgi:predicted CoA-binding protein